MSATPMAESLFGNNTTQAVPATPTIVPTVTPAATPQQSEADTGFPKVAHVAEPITVPADGARPAAPTGPVVQGIDPATLAAVAASLAAGKPAEQQTPGQPATSDPSKSQTVPLPVMLDERRRAQAAEQQLQAVLSQNQQMMGMLQQMMTGQLPQQQQEQIDPDAPVTVATLQAFAQNMAQQMETGRINERLNDSQYRATQKYGAEAVSAALEAAKASGTHRQFISQPDAYEALVNWHKGQQVVAQIGTDPEAYAAKIRQQVMAELLQQLQAGKPLPANIPPAIAGATSAQSAVQVVAPTRDFVNNMFAPKPRQQPGRVA